MADRNLTIEEFRTLATEAEKCRRYGDLSDHDKFLARISMDPGTISPPCNRCKHYLGYGKCEAFRDGFTADHVRAVMEDQTIDCGNGFRYTPGE